MENLYNKIKKYNLEDAIKFEENDRQFLALKNLWEEIKDFSLENNYNISFYLALIIANSLVCYQLSGKWEDYWEEFSDYFIWKKIDILKNKDFSQKIIKFFKDFLKTCKYNKRFTSAKIKRLEKLKPFLKDFFEKDWEYFYKNMLKLRDNLAKTMNQKSDAKTIVFAVKMFSYGARNIFNFVEFPKEISIPIDSRLTNLFEKYKPHPNPLLKGEGIKQITIEKFYNDLALKMNISPLHLDAIIWNLYDELKNFII